MAILRRKSYNDLEKQANRLLAQTEDPKRRKKITEALGRYRRNMQNSKVAEKYEIALEEALEDDERNERGHYESRLTHMGTTDFGGPDPDRYEDGEFVSDVDHSKLKNKWRRYHFTTDVYRDGAREQGGMVNARSNNISIASKGNVAG